MLIELILALVVGVLIGTLTGLFPGIHINLVSVFLLSISPLLFTLVPPIVLVVFIISLAITHTFVDFIPSIFLGAPNEDTALSILPGHELLLGGHGYTAVILTVYGGLTGILILLILTPLFILFLPSIYQYITRIMPIILILISGFLILSEGKNKRLWALIIFLLAGFLGHATLNLPMNEPLLPLFSGLFGLSSLILSIKTKTKIPPQKIFPIKQIRLSKSSFAKSTLATTIASPFTAVLPGLGASQAALIGSEVAGDLDEKEFLFVIGAINVLVMALSFIAFYSINKSRTGAAAAVSRLLQTPDSTHLIIMIIAILSAGIIAAILTIKLAGLFSNNISRFNYTKISIIIMIILIILTIFFSGILGLLILITSASLGIACIEKGVKRTELMGCLLIPTILYYIF